MNLDDLVTNCSSDPMVREARRTIMRLAIGAVLSLACLSGSAWALTPMDPIQDTWTASPMPNGGTYYSNGLDVLEVSPSGPSSAAVHGWTRDGRETSGTISTAPRYDLPREPSLTERLQRRERDRSSPRAPVRR